MVKNCCNHKKTAKKCRRKDGKIFKLPRRFSKKKCMGKVRGYSMKSSCAPYNHCKKGGGIVPSRFSNCYPGNYENPELCENTAQLPRPTPRLPPDIIEDIILKALEMEDIENKIRKIDERIINLEKDMKLKQHEDDEDELENLRGEKSKLEIEKDDLEKYREKINKVLKDLQRGGKSKKKKTKKKQFFFNPKDPKNSYDVYIDKNPKDTIPIKFKLVKDVKNTIKKLERLYKSGKYSHKRIWQVGMIMYVRLKVLKDIKKKQFKLSQKYFKFLGKRTKIKSEKDRKNLLFKM